MGREARRSALGAGVIGVVAVGIAVAAVGVVAPSAGARPVRIGRYTEIPYGVPVGQPWATAGGDARRSGRSPVAIAERPPALVWQARLGAGRPSAPLVTRAGDLFVATAAGVTALGADGTVRWTARIGFAVGTPSLTPSFGIASATHGGELFVLAPDGEPDQRVVVGGAVRGSPLVLDDGSVVLAAYDMALHRFDADGRRLFRVPLAGQAGGSPAFTPGGEIVVPAADRLYFVSPRGTITHTVVVGAAVVAGPAVADDGTVWVATQDGAVQSIGSDGSLEARTDLGASMSPASATLAVGRDGAVWVPTSDDALVCIGPGGTERFRVAGEGGFLAGPVLTRSGAALVITERGKLIAIAPDGTILWRADTGERTDQQPVLGADGTIYVASVRGVLEAWR